MAERVLHAPLHKMEWFLGQLVAWGDMVGQFPVITSEAGLVLADCSWVPGDRRLSNGSGRSSRSEGTGRGGSRQGSAQNAHKSPYLRNLALPMLQIRRYPERAALFFLRLFHHSTRSEVTTGGDETTSL